MNAFVAQIRRELWEHPVLYAAPAVIAAALFVLSVVGLGVSASFGPTISLAIDGLDADDLAYADVGVTLALLAFLPAFVLPVVVIVSFYLLDCLITERRDRSILFFKSLPVSDLTTVLAKLATALLVVPALALAALAATQLGVLAVASVGQSLNGGSVALLWSPGRLISVWMFAIYCALAGSLWYSPAYCFFLAVSAWARRAPLLWAASPLLLIVLERSVRGRSLIEELIGAHITGFWTAAFTHRVRITLAESEAAESMQDLDAATFGLAWSWADPVALVTSPTLWGGLAAAACFTATAALLRRYRDDS